jgi:TolA-binding protein
MFLLEKYPDALKYFSNMLKQYPKHSELKNTMFLMGQCNEKTGRKEQAVAFYKKTLSMNPGDNDDTISKVKQALSALGE